MQKVLTNKKWKIGKYVLLLIILVSYLLIGEHFSLFIPCPIHYFTHLYCPGCGVTRMLLHLLHGRFVEAFHANPLLLISLPFFALYYLDFFIAEQKKQKSKFSKFEPYLWYGLIGLFLIYGVLRNIPFFSFLAPR